MTESPGNAAKKITLCGLLVALSMVLSLADSRISAAIPFLPGIKIGLANIVTLYALFVLGIKYGVIIVAARCVLTGLVSGMLTMTLFSIVGGFISLFVMFIFKNKISVIKTSVLGGIAHNAGQILVAVLISSTPMAAYYFPVLVLTGAASGFCMGIAAALLMARIKKSF